MAKASGGKKKATIFYERCVEGVTVRVQRTTGKKARRGF